MTERLPHTRHGESPFVAVHVVPTGIGAAVGGYAGDATPATNLLAAAADVLLTHPNAVNAAGMMGAAPSVWYVEGYWLDEFMQGRCGLRRPRSNRIGVLVDRAAEAWLPLLSNAVEATRAVHGVSVSGLALTDAPVGGRAVASTSGSWQGTVADAGTLRRGAENLVEAGAQALAVFTCIADVADMAVTAYESGAGPDPVGGVEAAISRLLAATLRLPVAHAPVFPPEVEMRRVDPRAAAEAVSLTFVPCVLQGLRRAPRPVEPGASGLPVEQVAVLVAPVNALGGPAVLAARGWGIPVVAVRQNRTVLNVDAAALGWDDVWEVENYLEAAGVLLAMRQGIDPRTVLRPWQRLPATGPEITGQPLNYVNMS